MSTPKMHADEVEINISLVRQLLESQFPQWAHLPLKAVQSAGTDHALYRLGDSMVMRLPRIVGAIKQADKEFYWLPQLAPYLPLTIPNPIAQGQPGGEYPYQWSIYGWLEGENATLDRLTNPHQAATQLADFISALQKIDATNGPPSGEHNFCRGVPLIQRDSPTRAAIEALHDLIDSSAATAAWELALQTPTWQNPPVWIHGDFQSGNLLATEGKISAVIDFGGLGVGDPACDLIVAWNLLTPETRQTFRAALQSDEATWARGRGWALSIALIQLPYYQHTNPFLASNARYTIEQVLSDHE
ncbi:aminoglycoside phosphotransferase family protein [bacterium]|nr:MAG: aminoglycoside phosphotransferase family protein [bacterium]